MITVETLLPHPFTLNVHKYESIAFPAKGKHVFKSEAEYLPYKDCLLRLEADGMLKVYATVKVEEVKIEEVKVEEVSEEKPKKKK